MTDANALPHYRMFIDGEWTDGSDGQTLVSENPATGEPWTRFACASKVDVGRAVAVARRALNEPSWRDITATDRGKLIFRPADLIETLKAEMFGPVMSIVPFDTEEEAIAMANPFVMR